MTEFSSRSPVADVLVVLTAVFGVVYSTVFLAQFLLGVAVILLVVFVYLLWRLVVTGEAVVDALRAAEDRREPR